MKKKLITKAIQSSIDDHRDFVWIQDHLNNIFLCRISFHENGREIIKKFASFYIPEELEQAIELHHAVFDAIKDRRNKPLISAVLGNFVWRGLVEPSVLSREVEREQQRAQQSVHPTVATVAPQEVNLDARRASNASRWADMHTHPEKFHFIRSSRIHKRPPRFFVTCSFCGTELQAVENIDGTIHAFTTNKKRTEKRVYSFRLNEKGAKKVRAMQKKGLL